MINRQLIQLNQAVKHVHQTMSRQCCDFYCATAYSIHAHCSAHYMLPPVRLSHGRIIQKQLKIGS